MNGLNIDSYSSFPLSNISAGLLANMVADPIDVYIYTFIDFFLPFFGSTFQYPRGQVRGSIVFRFVALQAQPRNMKKGERKKQLTWRFSRERWCVLLGMSPNCTNKNKKIYVYAQVNSTKRR